MTFEGGSRSNKHSLLDLTYNLKIRCKLEAWILKLGGVFLLSCSWQDPVSKWCSISATSISHTLDLNPSVNSFGPKLHCQPIRLLNLKILWSWTLSNVNPPLRMGLHHDPGWKKLGVWKKPLNLTLGLKIRVKVCPNSKIGFSNHEEYFLKLGLWRFGRKNVVKLAPLHFLIPWTLLNPSIQDFTCNQ